MLTNEHSTCFIHSLHNIVTKTIGESEFVGHLHAIHTVASIGQRRNQIMQAARHVLEKELHVIPGFAPPENDLQSDFILDMFVFREQEVTRSEAVAEGILQSQRADARRSQRAGFRRYVNGNKAHKRIVHHCSGCCVSASGITTRQQQVDNFLAALVGIGLFSSGAWILAPSKARWLSSSATLSIVVAGLLIHGLLERVWQVAFPNWHIERPLNADEESDWHKLVRSKCFRAKLYLSGQHTTWRTTCISVATQPVDHLMQRLQSLDEAGGALLDLKGCSNSITLCMQRLFRLATTLDDTVMQQLSAYFTGSGLEFLVCVHQYIFRLCFALAGQIWFYIVSTLESFPYLLLELVSPAATSTKRQALS